MKSLIEQARQALEKLSQDDRFADEAMDAMTLLNIIESKVEFYERVNDVSTDVASSAADVIGERLRSAVSPKCVVSAPSSAAGLDERGLDLGCIEDMGLFLESFGFVAGSWIGIFVEECRRIASHRKDETLLLSEDGFEAMLRFIKAMEADDDNPAYDVQLEYSVDDGDGIYSPWQASADFDLEGFGCSVRAYFFVTTPHDGDGESLPPERTVRVFVVKNREQIGATIEHVCDLCSDTRPGKLQAIMPEIVALTKKAARFLAEQKGA